MEQEHYQTRLGSLFVSPQEFNAAAVGFLVRDGLSCQPLSTKRNDITKEYVNGWQLGRPGAGLQKPLVSMFDVEQASFYYLDYQNRRADHVNKLEIIDWMGFSLLTVILRVILSAEDDERRDRYGQIR